MRRLIFISLLIVLPISQVAYGEKPTTVEEAINLANQEIYEKI